MTGLGGAAVDGVGGGGVGGSLAERVLSTGGLVSVDEFEKRLHMKDDDNGQVLQTIFTRDGNPWSILKY